MTDYEDTHIDTGGDLIETPDLDAHGNESMLREVTKPPWRCRCGKTGGEHSDYQWSACWPRIDMKETR